MRFVERKLWPCLALALVACSLVTEFPEPKEELSNPDGGRNDGGRPNVSCDDNDGCDDDQLCCGKQCVPTGEAGCSECGESCDLAGSAPNCNDRSCECELGSGKGCAEGQFCDGEGKDARCVGCRTSADCAANGGGLTQCLDANCVECLQNDPANPLDDEGCSDPAKSVCNANNVCESCTRNDQCGPNQTCTESRGCFGCNIRETDLSKNGCTTGAPICRAVGPNSFQCGRCEANQDCPNAFCDERTGTCHNACDPNPVPAGAPTGCETVVGRGTCKADPATGAYSCLACMPADCAAGTTCATTGPQAGRCVVGPAGPADCKAPTPAFFEGKCVECAADADCATSIVGKYCNAADHKCAPCDAIGTPATRDSACLGRSAMTPLCNEDNGLCGTCKSSRDCSATTPICAGAATCVACTAITTPSPDAACDTVDDGSMCVTAGAPTVVGSCAECDPGRPVGMNGCGPRDDGPFCVATATGASCEPCVVGATDAAAGACTAPLQCTASSGGNRCTILGILPIGN